MQLSTVHFHLIITTIMMLSREGLRKGCQRLKADGVTELVSFWMSAICAVLFCTLCVCVCACVCARARECVCVYACVCMIMCERCV